MNTFYSKVNAKDFNGGVDGKATALYILKNKNGMEMSVTNFGARVVELFVPDKNGVFEDVVLGLATLDDYVNYKGERFLGATIGRFGNRIAKGKFTLNGTEYSLPLNDGANSLHGGFKGFDMKVWDVLSSSETEIRFALVSPDGDEGFPACLKIEMVYRLTDDNAFEIEYFAESDADTVVNLTHHSFFNLHGEGEGTINDHTMFINADKYTPVGADLIPTGEIADVAGTPLDFRTPTQIGLRVDDDFEQLKFGRGYDHNWVLNKGGEKISHAATVFEPKSGREMKVFTSEPAIQFYGGNFFDGKQKGKSGKAYERRATLALETQHYPDSPNQANFPSTILKKGEKYHHFCSYTFRALAG